jgi:hypothetical protein
MNLEKTFGRSVIAAAVGLFLSLPVAATAQSSIATGFDLSMVSAFDPQLAPAPPTTTTTTPRHYRQARARLAGIPGGAPGHRVRIQVYGSGAMCATEPGHLVHARLGLRVTLGPITFEDVVADCPPFPVPPAGNLISPWVPLTVCLPPAWAPLDLALNNIEVLSTHIVDTMSGLPTLAPGFREPQAACPVPATALPEGRLLAHKSKVQFVQAMDPCSPGTPFPPLPDICLASNILTDGTPFSRGQMLSIDNVVRWRLVSSPIGAPLAGKTVRLMMAFRATDPAAPGQLTFPDQTILCPPVLVPASGNVSAFHDLHVDCGLLPTNLDENMEATAAAIIDAGTGLAIAVPGVRQP